MKTRNVLNVVDRQKRYINPAYDIGKDEIQQLADIMQKKGGTLFFVIVNAFIYGYSMGHKAAIAEMKKGTE